MNSEQNQFLVNELSERVLSGKLNIAQAFAIAELVKDFGALEQAKIIAAQLAAIAAHSMSLP